MISAATPILYMQNINFKIRVILIIKILGYVNSGYFFSYPGSGGAIGGCSAAANTKIMKDIPSILISKIKFILIVKLLKYDQKNKLSQFRSLNSSFISLFSLFLIKIIINKNGEKF